MDPHRGPDNEAALWSAWHDAAAGSAVDEALRGLYAELDAAVAARGPTCWVSGKCCKFDDYGHRLYVTGLEVAWFLRQLEGGAGWEGEAPAEQTSSLGRAARREPRPPDPNGDFVFRLPQFAEHPGACPYQIDGRCSTHAVRPLGCRVFFCQRGTEDWQQDLYEDFLRRLSGLHERHGIEYRYLDWIDGLNRAEAATAQPAGR
ncbi:MAG: hypothetical protein AAF800_03405 [Planctomycetota bacterium]